MKLTYLTSAGMLFLFLFSCTKESNFNDELVVAQARGTAPSERLSVVRLQVRIEDYSGISNDGNEYYTNGQQNVSATIRDTDGQFFFISNTTFKTPLRKLTFPFNPNLNNKADYRMVTNFPVALQTMEVGDTKLGGMRVWAYVDKSVEDFVMRYRYDIATNQPNINTSEVQVTRVNEYTWELVPISQSTGTADAEIKIRPATTFEMKYDVPFKITLTKI
jgi:hypothetical protein